MAQIGPDIAAAAGVLVCIAVREGDLGALKWLAGHGGSVIQPDNHARCHAALDRGV